MAYSDMQQKDFEFDNLPLGTGSALGAFLRSIYFTASSRLAVVGIRVSDTVNSGAKDLFTQLTNNGSALVSDLVLRLATEPYFIAPNFFTNPSSNCNGWSVSEVGTSQDDKATKIYQVTKTFVNCTELNKEDFAPIYVDVPDVSGQVFSRQLIKFGTQFPAQSLCISLYITTVQGVYSKEFSNTVMADAIPDYITLGIIPVACSGKRTSKCWFTVDSSVFREKLTLHLAGEEVSLRSDTKMLAKLIEDYTTLLRLKVNSNID